jgi:hypothetical protein
MLVALLSLSLAASAVDAAKLELDARGFTHVVAAMVRDRGCAAAVSAPLQIAVSCAGGQASSVSLETAWRAWESDPRAREDALQAAAGAASLVDRLSHPEPERLRLVVRSGAQLHALVQRRTSDPPAAWPLTRDLWAVMVLDAPSALSFVGQTELARLGLDRDAAHARAMANLQLAFPAPVDQGEGPVHMLEADGAYDASLLLWNALWEARLARTGGPLYAAVPDPGVLLWADGARPGALRDLRAVMGQARLQGGVLDDSVLRWTGAGWEIVE